VWVVTKLSAGQTNTYFLSNSSASSHAFRMLVTCKYLQLVVCSACLQINFVLCDYRIYPQKTRESTAYPPTQSPKPNANTTSPEKTSSEFLKPTRLCSHQSAPRGTWRAAANLSCEKPSGLQGIADGSSASRLQSTHVHIICK
jgi:hypothetical protein